MASQLLTNSTLYHFSLCILLYLNDHKRKKSRISVQSETPLITGFTIYLNMVFLGFSRHVSVNVSQCVTIKQERRVSWIDLWSQWSPVFTEQLQTHAGDSVKCHNFTIFSDINTET